MWSEGGLCLEFFLKVYCKFTYTCSHCTLKKHHMQSTSTQRPLYEGICKHRLLLLVLSCTKTVLYPGELEEYS